MYNKLKYFQRLNMIRLTIVIFVLSILFPKDAVSQNNGAAAVAAGAVAAGALITALSIEDIKEKIELDATEWILKNTDFDQFYLTTQSFKSITKSSISNLSIVTFELVELVINGGQVTEGKGYILFAFTSNGWISGNGINYRKVDYHLIDKKEWLNMMTVYSMKASGINDEERVRNILGNGKITNTHIRSKLEDDRIDFLKINSDSYLVADYSELYKIVYNERSFCIFLKKTADLGQIKRSEVNKIHDFFVHTPRFE